MVSLKSAHGWYSEQREEDGFAIGSDVERKKKPVTCREGANNIIATATAFDLVLLVVHAGSQSRASTSAGWSSPWSFGNGTYPVHNRHRSVLSHRFPPFFAKGG